MMWSCVVSGFTIVDWDDWVQRRSPGLSAGAMQAQLTSQVVLTKSRLGELIKQG